MRTLPILLSLTFAFATGCGTDDAKLSCGDGTTEQDGECVAAAEADADGGADADADDTGEPAGTDEDGDGVTLEDGDCDDSDATVYPGAEEIWDDGIDQDCDGEDTDAHLDRCRDAVPCPSAAGTYANIAEWATMAECSAISGNIEFNDHVFPETIPENCLRGVGGNVEVQTNEVATDLSGLSLLTTVGGTLTIDQNHHIESLSLKRLTSVGGDLNVRHNSQLSALSLDNLTDVGGTFNIYQNNALYSFAIDGLSNVGEGMWVEDNETLYFFSLANLTHVSLFDIRRNGELDSFTAENLRTGTVRIQLNGLCGEWVTSYIQTITEGGWAGATFINSNADC
jgi:hypothetical protein